MKYALTLLALSIGVLIGVAAVVLGEADDSPGLQGLGALLCVGMIVLAVRLIRQRRRRNN